MANDVHPVDQVLPVPKLLTLGLQHVLVMYAGAVAVPLILGISVVLFGVIHLAPGGPTDVYADNPSVSKEALEQIKAAYGLDQPLPRQYALWLGAMLTGDWGYSIRTGRPVVQDIVERLKPTFELGALSLALSFALALPLGVASAAFELKGIGGKFTLPTACILSGSIMLMLSPPEFATYSVAPSGVSESDVGIWPVLTGASRLCCLIS